VNWNFQEILTKDPSSAWWCDASGNIPPCGVALRRTCRCTEFHRVKKRKSASPVRNVLIIDSTKVKTGKGGSRGIAPLKRNLGTKGWWVVSLTSRLLYSEEKAYGAHWMEGWFGPMTSVHFGYKMFLLPGIKIRFACRPARKLATKPTTLYYWKTSSAIKLVKI